MTQRESPTSEKGVPIVIIVVAGAFATACGVLIALIAPWIGW